MICAITIAKLLAAIMMVESGGNLTPPDGDGGKSIGPYQIQYVYWLDSKTPGKWEMCRDKKYSEKVIVNYWKRYAPKSVKKSLSMKDCEKLARIHNGGPKGHQKESTVKYWNKVKTYLP